MTWSHFKPSLEATAASNAYVRLNEFAMNQQLMCFIKQTNKENPTNTKQGKKIDGNSQIVRSIVAKAINGENMSKVYFHSPCFLWSGVLWKRFDATI